MSEQTQAFETRVSPDGADLVQRWQAEDGSWGSWVLVGGTDDGDQMGDAEVEDWTPLVPVQPLVITEEILDVVAPAVVLGVVLTELRAQLEELDDAALVVREIRSPGWGEESARAMTANLREQLAGVQDVLDRIVAALPRNEADADEVED